MPGYTPIILRIKKIKKRSHELSQIKLKLKRGSYTCSCTSWQEFYHLNKKQCANKFRFHCPVRDISLAEGKMFESIVQSCFVIGLLCLGNPGNRSRTET